MVDHLEFETPQLVDSILGFWRESALQRFAFLYGRYISYDKVPLGIKAIVSAVYEPHQENAIDGLKLLYVDGLECKDQDLEAKSSLEAADKVAQLCGLTRVGMIFTDLIDDGSGTGAVKCKRHEKSFFLSSLEAYFAAHMQASQSLKTKYSTTGTYGSRFVTCVVSGNAEGGIEAEAYQVSETAVAMVNADLIEPSIAPQSMLVQPETENRYVPEIMYQDRNKYGTMMQHRAEPAFPVDYLLVNVTHGFPSTAPTLLFSSSKYPPANRKFHPQTPDQLAKVIHSNDPTSISDFQFLVHLGRTGLLSDTELATLCNLSISPNFNPSTLLHHPIIMHLRNLIPIPVVKSSGPSVSSAPSATPWSCSHCTFQNEPQTVDCEMCGLPK
jgi:nuclear protein localization family protein 4